MYKKNERSFFLGRESKSLEYKEQISKTFLKTVSAYANYRNGSIIFGIDDSKHIVGIEDIEQCCLNIEHMINDNIFPVPYYEIVINPNNTICLKVFEGSYKPYLYKNNAYRRNDSSTIEVDRMEYQRLVLEGKNQTFEEQISKDQHLTFHVFEHIMKEK